MNSLFRSFRARCLLGFAACAALLGYALYTQHFGGLVPCPLCTFQRGAFVALGLVFLAAALHAPKGGAGRAGYGLLAFAAAAAGAAIAGRHVWLQSLPPDQVPACGPDLSYMMEAFPLTDVLRRVFTGSGQCAEVDWTFLGLAMPAWSLVWFVLLGAWALHAGLSGRQRSRA